MASKDDDLLDDPGSLFLEELLNDVAADSTGSNDGEFRVSRHEVILSAVWGVFGPIATSTYSYSLSSNRCRPLLSEPGRHLCQQHRHAYKRVLWAGLDDENSVPPRMCMRTQ